MTKRRRQDKASYRRKERSRRRILVESYVQNAFSFFQANTTMRASSQPWVKREIWVSP